MNIAVLVGKFPVLSQPFIINQLTGLLDRGHTVDIYALEGPSGEKVVHPQITQYALLERTRYAQAPPESLASRYGLGSMLVARYGLSFPKAIASTLNGFKYGKKALTLRPLFASIPFLPQRQYDIIHCQFGVHALLGLELKKRGILQGRLLATFRGFDISEYVRRCGEGVYNELFREGDFFLTNCEFFRQRLIRLGCEPQHTRVHYSSIDCRRFRFTPRSCEPGAPVHIVTVGRLVEKKGIEYGIRAIAHLRKIHPNIRYTIIGDGPLRLDFMHLIHDLNLSSIVTLAGWQSQDDMIQRLDQGHILVAPSVTSQSGDQDAPVNTLKEAMAMGLPVIGTQHGGIPELIDDGVSGYLVPERDAEAIAAKLDILINHAEQWPTMGQAGRQKIETHFDIQVLNQDLVALYQHILELPVNKTGVGTPTNTLNPTKHPTEPAPMP